VDDKMKLVLNGINANLRFASAHMIPGHDFCGGIHGHSYHVDVIIEGERSGEFGFVVDFKILKSIVKETCDELDHKVLIPLYSDKIKFKNKEDPIDFTIGHKRYVIPREDCYMLPTNSTSAEELSKYFAENVFESLKKMGIDFNDIQICVNEGIGQGAFYSIKK
jgi:6-pyruvoyltetrahydropterin/6-carboxytetrahydropterin synthase